MKTINKILSLGAVAMALASCITAPKVDYVTNAFISFPDSKFTVKENAGEIKIPVSLHADKNLSTTVTYTVAQGEEYAKVDVDYTIEGTGVLNITNKKSEVSDSIVIRPVDMSGVITKNKKIVITLNEVTEDGIYLGATSSCSVTIVDIDAGLNLLVGNWVGNDLASNNKPAALDFDLELVNEGDEGLEDFPKSNIKIKAGMNVTDPIGNDWSSQVDVYCFFNDETSTLQIYPGQVYDAGNFGDPYGVLYVALDTSETYNGAPTPVEFMVEDGVMTLNTDIKFVLYDEKMNIIANCGSINSGAQVQLQ